MPRCLRLHCFYQTLTWMNENLHGTFGCVFFFSVSIGRTSVFCMIFVNRILQVVKYERKKKVKVTLWL